MPKAFVSEPGPCITRAGREVGLGSSTHHLSHRLREPSRIGAPEVAWLWHGASRTRTGDLLGAIQALSQLSYSPADAEV